MQFTSSIAKALSDNSGVSIKKGVMQFPSSIAKALSDDSGVSSKRALVSSSDAGALSKSELPIVGLKLGRPGKSGDVISFYVAEAFPEAEAPSIKLG